MQVSIDDLIPGSRYVFGGEKWPLDAPIERVFIGRQEVAMRNGSLEFLRLRKDCGTQHLVLVNLVSMILAG